MPAWAPVSSIETFRSAVIPDLDELTGSTGQEGAATATGIIPIDSAKKDPFQYLRVRSLFGWAILGFLLVLFLVYICPFTKEIREHALITYILFVSAEIWALFWVIWKFKKNKLSWKRFLGVMPRQKSWKVLIPLLFGMGIFSYGVFYLFWYLVSFAFPTYVEIYILNNDLFTYYGYIPKPLSRIIVDIILMIAVAPFVEETIFRGIILRRWAGKWGIKKSIVLSSVLFALLHHDILGTFIFAMVMSIVYLKYRTLWIPMICHAVWNTICVIISCVIYGFGESTYSTLSDFRSYLWLGILSVCLSIPWIVIYIRRNWIFLQVRYKAIGEGSSIYKDGTVVTAPLIKNTKKEKFSYLCGVFLAILIGISVLFVPIWISKHRVMHPTDLKSPERLQYMLEYRRERIPEIREYEKLFPNYLCEFKSIKGFFASGDADWEFTAGIYDRYVMVMNIEIEFGKRNPETGEIEDPGSHQQPEFSLWEVTRVKSPENASEYWYPKVTKRKIQSIPTNTWKRLVETNGDLSVLGIELVRDDPVPNFSLAFRNNNASL